MSYSLPHINSLLRFVLACGFGIIMGAVYELFSLAGIIFAASKKVQIASDCVFGLIFALFSFFFMLVFNEGQLRLNLLFGQLSGLFLFNYAFSERINSVLFQMREQLVGKICRKALDVFHKKRGKNE